MSKRKDPVTRDELIAAAGALLASSGGLPVYLQGAVWAAGLGLLAWAAIR